MKEEIVAKWVTITSTKKRMFNVDIKEERMDKRMQN